MYTISKDRQREYNEWKKNRRDATSKVRRDEVMGHEVMKDSDILGKRKIEVE